MVPLVDAQRHLIDHVEPLTATFAEYEELLGRVLSEPVVSAVSVPPFANTAVDGFAVRSADVKVAATVLTVVTTIAAGDVAQMPVEQGQAARIMTGAPIPDGADAVVMVEQCRVERRADGVEWVSLDAVAAPGQHIRRAGDDVESGDVVLTAGTLATPAVVGVLRTLGLTGAAATRRPIVAVLSTGDELVEAPAPLGGGQIYESNRHTLMALLAQSGFETVDLGLVADDEAAIETALREAAGCADAVVTSGGVSMGDFDLVKVVLDRIGDMVWMQVAVKPAKPLAFGTIAVDDRRVPVFGLPGNPVSSMVSFELFARPALRKMAGHSRLHRPVVAGVAATDLRRRSDGKVHFARVSVEVGDDGTIQARPSGAQGSHQLSSMVHADGLAVLADGEGVAAGERVDLMLLDWSGPADT